MEESPVVPCASAESKSPAEKGKAPFAIPAPASAHLTWRSGGRELGYTATASHITVSEDDGQAIGWMFSLAYVADAASGAETSARPVTFCYNGGPGCASVPINFGGIGPRRVVTDGTAHLRSDAKVEDNPHTLLLQSDLVFLDALGTGWSRLAVGTDPKRAYGADADAEMFCRAIIAWLEENGRWGSPVYLYGESYGTMRNAILMRLLGESGVVVTGVTMLSAIFNWAQDLPGDELYYLGMLPTFASTAHWFGKAGKGTDVYDWFAQAERFATEEYSVALLKGDSLEAGEKSAVARRISELIGLPADLVERLNLRVDLDAFRKNLLGDEGKMCGRLDTRFCGDAFSVYQTSTDFFEWEDPAAWAVEVVWESAFRDFVKGELGYEAPARYLRSNLEVTMSWEKSHEQPGLPGGKIALTNVNHDMAVALRRNPTCKMQIIGGLYDTATPWWNVRHDVASQFLSSELKERIEWHLYGCGHMAYVDVPTLEAMGADTAAFYARR